MAPFERVDLATLLYTRILSKESFQLVVNTFDDKEERENVIHRIGQIALKGEKGKVAEEETKNLVSDCRLVGINSSSIVRSVANVTDSKEPNSRLVGVVDPLDLQSPRSDKFLQSSSLGSPFSIADDTSKTYPDVAKGGTLNSRQSQSKISDDFSSGPSRLPLDSPGDKSISPTLSPQGSPINRSYKGKSNPFDVVGVGESPDG